MTPLLRRALHAGVIVMAALAQACERIELLFRSKEHVARRSAGRFAALRRKEMEEERLDRLRNPDAYRGR